MRLATQSLLIDFLAIVRPGSKNGRRYVFTWEGAAITWHKDPVTRKQLDFLDELGYRLWRPRTKGEASFLIDSLKAGLTPAAAEDRLRRALAGETLPPLPTRERASASGCGFGCAGMIVAAGVAVAFVAVGIVLLFALAGSL